MMPHGQKNQPQAEVQDLPDDQVPMDEEQEAATPSSSNLIQVTPMQMPAGAIPSYPQSSQRASSPPNAMAVIPSSSSDEASHGNPEGDPAGTEAFLRSAIKAKVRELVTFLLHKYETKEAVTEGEVLGSVIRNYQHYSNEICVQAVHTLRMFFGMDIKVMGPENQYYVLVPALGLTYDGLMSDVQGMPKTGLLILVLGLVFMENASVSEEDMWGRLEAINVYAHRHHYIFGNPWKLVTEDFVQEGYLEYRQVPHTDPARYEFLWGPRAYAETSKLKVLFYICYTYGFEPISCPLWCAQALIDEAERAQPIAAHEGKGPAVVSASSHAQAGCSKDEVRE